MTEEIVLESGRYTIEFDPQSGELLVLSAGEIYKDLTEDENSDIIIALFRFCQNLAKAKSIGTSDTVTEKTYDEYKEQAEAEHTETGNPWAYRYLIHMKSAINRIRTLVEAMRWKDMETAPKDRLIFLKWEQESKVVISTGQYFEPNWVESNDIEHKNYRFAAAGIKPSAWMEIPE